MMKFFRNSFVLLAVLVFSDCSSHHNHNPQHTLFQTSTINALLKGDYDGNMTFKQLKKHGNFGLGTVNTVNGEMVGLDGKFYQVRTNGKAYLISDRESSKKCVRLCVSGKALEAVGRKGFPCKVSIL